ncbi:MAG: helix-turn-helix transcriptional regulator [Paludibacter sp.]|nr:helix-turn-helix transcriptional regulator [Paludibacter sp.]
MNEKVRIEKIMQVEGMSSGQFANEIGIQNSTLSHILNNRNNPSLDVMKKILNRFPNINSDWLILGLGPIFRQEMQSQVPTLFGDDDELFSLSDTSSENELRNSSQNSDPNNQNTVRSTPEATYTRLSTKKSSVEQHDKHLGNQGHVENDLKPESNVNNQQEIGELRKTQIAFVEKKVSKIILYYSDHTFQEFDSK